MNFKRYIEASDTWVDSHYIMGTSTDTIATLPAVIYANDTTATVGLKGQTVQSSTPSPTSPVMPQGTGERTGNLFDFEQLKNAPSGTIGSITFSHVLTLQLKANTYYTMASNGTGSTSSTPADLYRSVYFNATTGESSVNKNNPVTVLTDSTGVVRIGFFSERANAQQYLSGEAQLWINEGNTALPYEPYGIKIPISCGGTTNNVYLGEVQTTRQIKKLVLTGEENITFASEDANRIVGVFMIPNMRIKTSEIGYCNILHWKNEYSQSDYNRIVVATSIVFYMSLEKSILPEQTIDGFITYLRRQYAAGTPITIWYVLATPETGITNEPLMKIGSYSDSLTTSIPCTAGENTLDVQTTVAPSEVSAGFSGWHNASEIVHRYQYGEWDGSPPPVTSVVYGWHVDPSIADSSDAVTYLEDAVGMTPAAMGASTFDYGSWENAFFMPKPCMVRSNGEVAYYLDPNDYSKKADGTPSDVANPDFDGNAMMEWGKIWYKFVGGETDGEGYFYVSNEQVDDSYHCWCNYDSKDNITDHFYTAIYNGTGTTKLRSISGVALTSANGNGRATVTQEVARATANNTTADVEWYTDVWADRLLINALLVLIGKSLNTQATFGRGLDTGGQTTKEAYVTGSLDDKGLFWGVTADGNSAVKVFGMENWWGCVWRRTAGCISVDRALKIKLTYGTADGSTAVGYNQTGSGYISDGTIPSSSNYVKAMAYNQYGYMTDNVTGGSSSTYYADYFYQNTGTRYLLVGGYSGSGVSAGAFYFRLNTTPSDAAWNIAASLSFKPLAMKG